jgi:hypothetical protein
MNDSFEDAFEIQKSHLSPFLTLTKMALREVKTHFKCLGWFELDLFWKKTYSTVRKSPSYGSLVPGFLEIPLLCNIHGQMGATSMCWCCACWCIKNLCKTITINL